MSEPLLSISAKTAFVTPCTDYFVWYIYGISLSALGVVIVRGIEVLRA